MPPPEDGDAEMPPAAEETGAAQEEPVPEAPPELEQDAKDDSRPKLPADTVVFHPEHTTINLLPTTNGKMLTSLSHGGLQYLLAGARANVGIKAGRYLFEVTVIEAKSAPETSPGRGSPPRPKQLVRLGFATSDASLILGDGSENSFCFDSQGLFKPGPVRTQVSQPFAQGQVIGLLLNLDASSPNANTASVFIDGIRASQPQPIPESLRGKVLYPAVTFRNVSLQVHFGPNPLRPLPFKSLTLQQAAKADVEIKAAIPQPPGGKHEVLLPIGLPDEGTFDFADQFLAKNGHYVELSQRMILDWAQKSGVQRPGGYQKRSSIDNPEPGFGLPLLDDGSVLDVLNCLAPVLPRNYLVMQVEGNLLAEERAAVLKRFANSNFKTVALVAVGEPPADFKAWVQNAVLQEKQAAADLALKAKKEELQKRKLEEERKKKLLEERKRKAEAAEKAKKAAEGGEEAQEEKPKEEKEQPKDAEAPAAEAPRAEEKAPEALPEEELPEVAVVALTEEEKRLSFRKNKIPDLSEHAMSESLTKFTIPSKEEGFDELRFVWLPQEKCDAFLRTWVTEKKLVQRVENLQPSEWFRGKQQEWGNFLAALKRRHVDFVEPNKRRAALLQQKKKAPEVKKPEAKQEDGAEPSGEAAEAKEETKEETKEEVKEEVKDEPMKPEINAEDLDVFAVEDIMDIGNGEPLFAHFENEDWALVLLRFELHLLVHAFRHDLDDPERQTFHKDHLPFYYSKYYRKALIAKNFGVSSTDELVEMIQDTVELDKNSTFVWQLSADTPLENFVKLTEDQRRERQRRIDAGDESAKLVFARMGASPRIGQAAPIARGAHQPGRGPAPTGRSFYPGKGGPQPSAASARGGSTPYGVHKRPVPALGPATPYPPTKMQRPAFQSGAYTVPSTTAYYGGNNRFAGSAGNTPASPGAKGRGMAAHR